MQREKLFVATKVAVVLGIFLVGFAASSRACSQLGVGLLTFLPNHGVAGDAVR